MFFLKIDVNFHVCLLLQCCLFTIVYCYYCNYNYKTLSKQKHHSMTISLCIQPIRVHSFDHNIIILILNLINHNWCSLFSLAISPLYFLLFLSKISLWHFFPLSKYISQPLPAFTIDCRWFFRLKVFLQHPHTPLYVS